MRKIRRAWRIAVATVAAGWMAASVAASGTGLYGSCYVSKPEDVCRCIDCPYLVWCGLSSWPPSVQFSVCNATNPGQRIPSFGLSTSGLSAINCAKVVPCGTARVTGVCCGGARTTVEDWSVVRSCVPTGTACGPAGTAGGA